MEKQISRRILIVLTMLSMLAAACALPTLTQKPTVPAETQAAQTLEVLMTQVAGSGATLTPEIVTTTPGEPTLLPSSTLAPTSTTVVLPPQPTDTTMPVCDDAGFISDISVPDGSLIPAGSSFVKTWRLQNLGSCTWTPSYAVVFNSGDAMNGPSAQTLDVSVLPGQKVDVSVTLKAPAAPGHYRGYWWLRNAAGALFGLGAADDRFYVDIKVVAAPATGTNYDFTANLCLATWTGNGKTLPCIGKDGSPDGFVLYRANPTLESGYVDDEPGLITNPPLTTDGVIRGKYPAYTVKANDHFRSLIGCKYLAKNCNVRFQLDYQIDNGSITTLGSWGEKYEGNTTQVDVDLSSLAGKNVQFILTVFANGASDQDRALWLLPRIVTPQPTATPTRTPTVTNTPTRTPTPTATATTAGYP
ncbi:MAG TPA: NBR1-Ig-like domain-containing protein [Anaerolineaceae bacterium]